MMALMGQTLGEYQLIEPIGQDGMAMVYKAYQPTLGRYVAIKALLPVHAQQPGFSERFQREARAIASLQHPHILPVHDFGQAAGYSYMVMPYIEGARTLKAVMGRPLSPAQALAWLTQIAAALDYAHQRGIVHRDVKPSNLLLDGDRVLLSDFGLAQLAESSVRLTAPGVGVGTPAYMSPEQGQGQPVDQRTDVYSFGTILFEMLTGTLPYDAERPAAIVFKRASQPLPQPRQLNPAIPEVVEQVILKALAPDPADRYASAGELAAALDQAIQTADENQPDRVKASEPAAGRSLRTRLIGTGRISLWIGVVGLGILACVILPCLVGSFFNSESQINWFIPSPAAPQPVGQRPSARFTPVPSPTAQLTPTYPPLPPGPTPLSTPPGGRIAFVSDRDGNWEIYVMYTDGSGLTNLTNHPANDADPAWSPDGRHLAFTSNRGRGSYHLYVVNVDEILRHAGDGGLACLTANVPYVADPAWSPDGRLVLTLLSEDENFDLYELNTDGSALTRLTDHPARDTFPAWSPDGRYIAFDSDRGGNRDIFVLKIPRPQRNAIGPIRLTNDPADEWDPVWSPDGVHLAFVSLARGGGEISVMDLAETEQGISGSQPKNLTNYPAYDGAPAWSPDGQRLVFASRRDGNDEIYIMDAAGTGLTRLTDHPADDMWPTWGR